MARPRSDRVTIRDVAARAQVSISTVSHVFSRARPISDATRERVLAAAQDLGYTADPTARSMRTGEYGLLGVVLRPRYAVVGSLAGSETFTRFLGACSAATLATGRGLVHVPDVLDAAAHRVPMDGCIVEGPYGDDDVIRELRARGVLVVSADIDPDHPDDPWAIEVDYRGTVGEIFEHFVAHGAQRLAFVPGTEDNAWNRVSTAASREWAAAAGASVEVRPLFEEAGAEGAEALITELLTGPEPPEAVLVGPSRFAAGAMRAAVALGRAVPSELQVAALTDSDVTRLHEPPITGVDLRMEDQGKTAVELLIRQMAGESPPSPRTVIVPHVRWRQTT